ncbi:porin [Halomonas mongoliensis]|uniref:Porin n=1 Tax=Halomonas mongoliensis TaxID=321265 RepID=A0ABU1GN97_9GAMM|nr:porin [Halomonas mongoliensis]MDR5893505.1 porin [Halomonas mongoliensis]
MFKKSLIATAVVGALSASAVAQAATVYDQDGTKVDIYGRINYMITSGGTQDLTPGADKTSGSEFQNNGSRFGFRASHELNSDLSAFARMEFRFNADEVNRDAMQVRNSFLGLKSQQLGTLTVGNFDSVYKEAVTGVFDNYENEGWVTHDGGSTSSRGDTVAYATPVFSGLQGHVQVKHISGNDAPVGAQDNSSTTSTAAAVTYTWEDLYLAAGYNQSKDVSERGASYPSGGGGNNAAGEDIWGVSAQYKFLPNFSARVMYEELGSVNEGASASAKKEIFGLGATFNYGQGNLYADVYDVSYVGDISSSNPWAIGVDYRFSPMRVYAEIFDEDASGNNVDDSLLYTVGIRYDF